MVIDYTAELAPIIWSMLCLLVIAAGALLACVDPDVTEIYFGGRRLLVATAALAVLALAALVVARPDIAAGFGLPLGRP
jgi:hypothetical protein